MKIEKNSLIITSLVLAGLIILISSFNGQQNQEQPKNKYLTLRTIEGGGMSVPMDNRIIIADEVGKIEEIPLEKSRSGNFSANVKTINDKINDLSNKGYELIEMSGTDQWTTTYVFKKAN